MPKRRYEILLPLTYNDGREIEYEKLFLTRESIAAKFGSVSYSAERIEGDWLHQGIRYRDYLAKIWVDVDDTDENRQFFVQLKPALLKRFEQLEIYIISFPVEQI